MHLTPKVTVLVSIYLCEIGQIVTRVCAYTSGASSLVVYGAFVTEGDNSLFYLFIYIIHIAIYGIHVTKQVKLKIQLEY